MAKKDWDEIEEWDELEDEDDDEEESEDTSYIADYNPPEQKSDLNTQTLRENQNAWGTIFWVLVVIIGGYFLFFNNNDSSKVQTSTVSYPSSTPVIRYSPRVLPKYTIPKYSTPYYSTPSYFGGYECTVDCSGHEAGYNWAELHDIDNYDDCEGNSQSFIEGCYSYVEDN